MNDAGTTTSSQDTAGKTLCDLVGERAVNNGDAVAYIYLADGQQDARTLTWSQLERRARALGAMLHRRGVTGQRVLLALPSGLAFIEWLFACWHAGAIAVPLSVPRHQRVKHRLDGIIADADALFAVGSIQAAQLQSDAKLTWIDSQCEPDLAADGGFQSSRREPVAILQYTSGSTASPRGVMVTHENLMKNSAQIQQALGLSPGQTAGGWLPLFHDMGLIAIIVQPAFSGLRSVFMSPERFLMRPWLWLKMISDYQVYSSAAPNFAYELCAQRITEDQKKCLNLGHWRCALNGSEPVRHATIERFAAAFAQCGFSTDAIWPCYGLAEATLFVTGKNSPGPKIRRDSAGKRLPGSQPGGHISCGKPVGETKIAIVAPQTRRAALPGEIGEIWVSGPGVAHGYWRNPDATAQTFGAHLDSSLTEDDQKREWLRTGDMGFVADGDLFITGRLRELIKIAGRNHFPIDLERTAENADAAVAPGGVLAFSVDDREGERLVIVAELRRETAVVPPPDAGRIRASIRAAIAAENDVTPHEVVLVGGGALPRTTSGKLNRRAAAEAFVNRTLDLEKI